MPRQPHIFWESDVGKWLEAASYTLATSTEPELAAAVERVVGLLERAQRPDGYLNAYFTVMEPEGRWRNLRDQHELYCAGHLIEAAVAHHQATGRDELLTVARRYADYIARVVGEGPGQKRGYPGHQEIELALVRLYQETGEERYFELSRFFVEERGRQPHYFDLEARERGEDPAAFWAGTYEYNQSHLPVREQRDAVGHCVRAVYLYSAMTDLAVLTGDESLMTACRRLAESVIERRMYLTGGIGSSRHNEGFTGDFDLPNATAYAESCAAIGLFFWMHRMLLAERDGRYADVMERSLYNGILSGISLTGDRFFYENPLAVDRGREDFRKEPHHRRPWYGTACCPPNLARLIASLCGYAYSEGPNEAVVNLYLQGTAELRVGGRAVTLTQQSDYPWQGSVRIGVDTQEPAVFALLLRLPGWCESWKLTVNGRQWAVRPERGYLRVERNWQAEDRVELEMAMPIERVYSPLEVVDNRGRVALQRGPIVYCLEGVDNGEELDALCLPGNARLQARHDPELLGGITVIEGDALRPAVGHAGYGRERPSYRPVRFTAIPYYAWDNREAGDMLVWIRESAADLFAQPSVRTGVAP